MDVLEADRLLVDEILALPVAEDAAAEGDFIVVRCEDPRAARERQGDFRHPERRAFVCAVENDVSHLSAAERFGRGLAKDPAHRIDDVRLAAAIRTHDTGDALVELEFGLVGEGFESVNLKRFKAHGGRGGKENRLANARILFLQMINHPLY